MLAIHSGITQAAIHRMPLEIEQEIIEYLVPRDIASLHCADWFRDVHSLALQNRHGPDWIFQATAGLLAKNSLQAAPNRQGENFMMAIARTGSRQLINAYVASRSGLILQQSIGSVPQAWLAADVLEELNARDARGRNAMFYAAGSGCPHAIEPLVTYGQSIDSVDRKGWTALHHAIDQGDHDAAVILLEAGADPNARTGRGNSSLHQAVRSDDLRLLNLVLRHGADPLALTSSGQSALQVAAIRNGNAALLRALIAAGCPVQTPEWKHSAVSHAAIRANLANTSLLIAALTDVNLQDDSGSTLLHYAVRLPSPFMLLELMKNNPAVNLSDVAGRTPLHVAAQASRIHALRILMNAGANIHLRDRRGATALHYAAASGNEEGLVALYERGAELNAKDLEGKTPLGYALRAGKTHAIQRMLQLDADF
jgi:ankyrin repeat protein